MLDISATAIQKARERLKSEADHVRWIEADVTSVRLESNCYDLWHDRAVFHFLTATRERTAYVENAERAIKAHGFLIVATFGLDGPTKCSGLPVKRYGPVELAAQFPTFTLRETRTEQHLTPSGKSQSFTYVLLQKMAENATS